MARYAVAGIVVVALALGVWWLLPRADETPSTTTLVAQPPSTSTTATTAPETTTTTEPPNSHVVETVEEAEEVLRQLWFGWFEGIYHHDEDRIREVVATEEQVATAKAQFGVMEFDSPPIATGLTFSETEILRSDESCLAVWSKIEGDYRPGSMTRVDVLRSLRGGWVLLSHWPNRDDLWESDCDALLS